MIDVVIFGLACMSAVSVNANGNPIREQRGDVLYRLHLDSENLVFVCLFVNWHEEAFFSNVDIFHKPGHWTLITMWIQHDARTQLQLATCIRECQIQKRRADTKGDAHHSVFYGPGYCITT